MNKKEAIEVVKNHLPHGSFKMLREALETLIPELKEPEGDVIRKGLITYFQSFPYQPLASVGINAKDAVAWLEKQGEQKPAPTVERKFNMGDWVATNINSLSSPLKIVDTSDTEYRIEDVNGSSGVPKIEYLDNKYHFWSIRDAKDGDVLVASDGSIFIYKGVVVDCACKYYVALTVYNDIRINTDEEGGYWETSRAVHPAAKEQRDLLFQAIKEAGYEWDPDQKELKISDWSKLITSKIDGPSPITVESADEDESNLDNHPKFKVGDWVVIKDVIGDVQITEITDTQYGTVSQFGTHLFFDINVLDREAHYAAK